MVLDFQGRLQKETGYIMNNLPGPSLRGAKWMLKGATKQPRKRFKHHPVDRRVLVYECCPWKSKTIKISPSPGIVDEINPY